MFVHRLPTTELIECEHLYSSYLFRAQAGIDAGGYPTNLSEVGHREETLFSYSMYKQGYQLLLNPNAIAWHYRNLYGGIRWTRGEFNPKSLWDHDEEIFRKEIAEMIKQPRRIRE